MQQQQFAPAGADEHRVAPHSFPAVEEDLGEKEWESALLAQTAHALAQVRRFVADEKSNQPALTASAADSRSPAAQGLIARAFAALTSSRNGEAA